MLASTCHIDRVAAASPTQAMNAMYDFKAVPLDTYQGAFTRDEHQSGAFGSETMGLDHPNTCTVADTH
jgi:hypothetical protein